MYLKMIGAVLIVVSGGALGFRLASSYKYEEKTLKQLVCALTTMQCELQYRHTPLPALCNLVAKEQNNVVGTLFSNLEAELNNQLSPNVSLCMLAALEKTKQLPTISKQLLKQLGNQLGIFDLDGQLESMQLIKENCMRTLKSLGDGRDVRLRNYQTLGLCAGAAISILFI